MPTPFPLDVPTDWRKQLNKLIERLPSPLVQGIPALRDAVEEARSVLPTNPDQETCEKLYMKISQARTEVNSGVS